MTARWVERATQGQVAITPWQTRPPQMEAANLSSAETTVEVWILTPGKEPQGGAAAINEALKYVWWARPLAWLYALPVIKQLEEGVYRWVARHRHLFPGVTPACESGAECVE